MKKLFVITIISLGLFVGCGEKQPKVPEIKAKYTIWVGGDIVQIGHQANEYTTKDGMITFRKFETGETITVPLTNVGSIENN